MEIWKKHRIAEVFRNVIHKETSMKDWIKANFSNDALVNVEHIKNDKKIMIEIETRMQQIKK